MLDQWSEVAPGIVLDVDAGVERVCGLGHQKYRMAKAHHDVGQCFRVVEVEAAAIGPAPQTVGDKGQSRLHRRDRRWQDCLAFPCHQWVVSH